MATQLGFTCRGRDLPVRLHGDEFAVLLGQLPIGRNAQREAEQRAAAIAAAISQPMECNEHVLTVTPSIGAAVAAAWHADLSAMLRAADQRMYAAKRSTHHAAPGAVLVGRWF